MPKGKGYGNLTTGVKSHTRRTKHGVTTVQSHTRDVGQPKDAKPQGFSNKMKRRLAMRGLERARKIQEVRLEALARRKR